MKEGLPPYPPQYRKPCCPPKSLNDFKLPIWLSPSKGQVKIVGPPKLSPILLWGGGAIPCWQFPFDASNYYNKSDSEFDLSWFRQKKFNVAFKVTVSIEVNIWLNLWLRVEKWNYYLTNTCNRLKHDFGWRSYAIFRFFFAVVNINQYKSLNQFNLIKISAIMNNTGIIKII